MAHPPLECVPTRTVRCHSAGGRAAAGLLAKAGELFFRHEAPPVATVVVASMAVAVLTTALGVVVSFVVAARLQALVAWASCSPHQAVAGPAAAHLAAQRAVLEQVVARTAVVAVATTVQSLSAQ